MKDEDNGVWDGPENQSKGCSIVMKRELSQKALPVYLHSPGHEGGSWAKNQDCWLKPPKWVSSREWLASLFGIRWSVIWEGLTVEKQLLCVESSQLRWFGHWVRMPPRPLLGGDRGADPGSGGSVFPPVWERPGIPQSELDGQMKEWRTKCRHYEF